MSITTIRCRQTTKSKLEAFKKGSYEDTILSMISYFEITGIDPTSNIGSPSSEIRKGTERVVKILRAFEKTYFRAMEPSIERLEEMFHNMKGKSVEKFDKNEVSLEEVQVVLDENKNLKRQLEEAQKELRKSSTEGMENDYSSVPKEVLKSKIEQSLNIIKDIEESMQKSNIETGKLVIPAHLFKQKIRLLKSELEPLYA